ncbi:branched-chain amino acid ABC transporter permease [Varunaivibrio sulfuroxidans]|uniref:Amino acid/amide ABC transporter membrane protein 2 (HAAT family) n=1 Tax=Varunaivibrio sulfuroxidans TaxID=1773489 RepID=A0A4R3JFK8_9PROT|nr:branched-chain amino acid ABC transporter permease [Varunaivibrio sulfuroxidans]TCS64063.1 amino acid/amide ABC transporter membrane protein 2 (HAAT family) [Varunaivibrio sulfuroxidans]WES31486.1 branched-chain amino acid ABC transporter permease [Varunaivibrio sulfuroxidans]
MIAKRNNPLLFAAILAVSIAAPLLFPDYRTQLALLWLMVIFAMTWDIMGGQMGYNSFGNILFFGIGMYACAVLQRDSGLSYFSALALGVVLAGALGIVTAIFFGAGILGLRGHYFAIGSLGLAIAAGEIAGGIDYIGAGSGMTTPLFPGRSEAGGLFFYFFFFVLATITFFTLRKLYEGRFGLAINAIRDDEDKAEAMGIRTTRFKTTAWAVSAFFLGMAGAGAGNLFKFIDPLDVAFAGSTYGVWMILMAILGGKGTLWGPVIGAVIFHITQELFWTYLLGWQRVALGLLIVIIVVFFPQGILGWMRERWPERFGQKIDEATRTSGGAA